ncbi:putative plastidic glucose transporter 4 [Coleophoma cylindrospora]|uniref:Quinate transporter n=1 Tax=Coleophoma cylindrospora TaxID=1849047 RepID=A0A3D8S8U6_9HELO|nr:putative plastidic glucose transporter 4 [Coleophoma cylindrospora]
MGLLAKVEDRPTPPAVYNWRVYTCAAIAGSAAIMIGYDSAFIGTTIALTSFKSEFGLDQLSTAKFAIISENIVSVYQAGAFFGALLAYIIGHFIGRKRGLAIFSGIFFLGAGLMLGANGSRGLGLIYAGRVLAGLGVGGASNLTPIYISEVAPPAIRGRLVGFYELSWQIGGLVGFWINYGVNTTMAPSHKQWLIPFAIQLIPAAGLFLGSFWLRESPRWLLSKNKREQALRNLSWIRHLPLDDVYIKEEVYAIDTALEEQRSTVGLGFWQPFKKVANDRKTLYRFFLGASLFFWQNGSGINAINYYSPTIFKSIGITGLNTQLFTTGLFGVVKTCLTLIWLFYLVDKWGRRNILMVGALGGSLCMWYVGGFIAVADPTAHPSSKLSSGGISAVFFFYLWTAFYTPSWNGTPWVYNSEMFDQNVRTLAQASAAANNWLWNFLISRFTPQMFVKMGYGVYFFFASLMLLSVPFVFFLLPETKSIPLEAIDRLFDRQHAVPRKAHGMVLLELRAEEAALRAGLEGENLTDEKQEVLQVENRV